MASIPFLLYLRQRAVANLGHLYVPGATMTGKVQQGFSVHFADRLARPAHGPRPLESPPGSDGK